MIPNEIKYAISSFNVENSFASVAPAGINELSKSVIVSNNISMVSLSANLWL